MEAIHLLKDLDRLAAPVTSKLLLRLVKLAVEYFMIQTKSMVLSSSTVLTRLTPMLKAQKPARIKVNSSMMQLNSLASMDWKALRTF